MASDSKIFGEKAGEPLRSRKRATSDNENRSRRRKVPPPSRAEAEFAKQHSADPALRKTGIPVMGDMPWGAHLCVFFETKADCLTQRPPISRPDWQATTAPALAQVILMP
jgi:hypothetical protein